MTIPELAKYFGIPKKRVYEMLRREADAGFPGFRVGSGWRIDLEQLREWMCEKIEERAANATPVTESETKRR
jgi:excisionase family DNA binding protein